MFRSDIDKDDITGNIYQVKVKITFNGGKKLILYSNWINEILGTHDVAGTLISALPDGLSQNLNFCTLESTISNMSVNVTNGMLTNGKSLSQYLYERLWDKENKLKNAKVEIYIQTGLITNSLLYTGYLESFKPVDVYENEYTLNIEDVTRQIKKECLGEYFDVTTELSDYPIAHYNGVFTKFARRELDGNIAASGIKNYEETSNISVLETWKSNEYDWWYVIRYTGHPIEFAKELIYLTAGANSFDESSFDVVKNNSKNSVITAFDYELKEEISDALEYIREQCFFPCLAYFYVENNGKIYLKQVQQPTMNDELLDLSEDNSIELLENDFTFDNIVNYSNIKFDYNEEKDEYISSLYDFDDGDSLELFGKSPEDFTVEIMGLNRNAILPSGILSYCADLSGYIFNRNALSVKVIKISAMFQQFKNVKVGSFIKVSNSKMIDWKKISPNLGGRGLNEISSSKYAIIDISFWGDYVSTYEGNEAFADAQEITEVDKYNGSLTWNYKWYIQSVPNKAVPITVKNNLELPIGHSDIRNNKQIKIEMFEDILLNYKINENFLAFHNAD